MNLAGQGSRVPVRTRCFSRGATLVEVLVAIVVVGAMAAIMSLDFGALSGRNTILGATARVASRLESARAEAVRTGQEVAVKDFKTIVDDTRVEVEGIAFSPVQDKQSGIILFFPDGSSSGGMITLSDSGATAVIRISWLDGHVDVP